MLDLTDYRDLWPDELAPIGFGKPDKEPFAVWWARVGPQLSNLHPLIAEQWVYRHWKNSPFIGLDLAALSWELMAWPAETILAEVVMAYGPLVLDPERDFKHFNKVYPGKGPNPTRAALDKGTWDYPIVTLKTPGGFRSEKGDFPDARLVLVEGHNRLIYFNALHARGLVPGLHQLFVMEMWG